MELKSSEILSVIYHDIFNYPLSQDDLVKWRVGKTMPFKKKEITFKKKYFLVKGREEIIAKRISREKASSYKIKIAKKASMFLSYIPSVKFVGITGALAMKNADKHGDIDLFIITKSGQLWLTRLISYVVLFVGGFKTRNPGNTDEKDKLCLNMWLDEDHLSWNVRDRNIYTAHEVLQIVPLYNKDDCYNKFLYINKWAQIFWPNASKIKVYKSSNPSRGNNRSFLERISFYVQYQYMKKRISREIVTKNRAIFHPNDWGKTVLSKLTS